MGTAQNMTLISLFVMVVHALGLLNAAHAVMNVRLSQSAIAWSISLITFPWISIPLYWVLGRSKFHGYTEAVQSAYEQYWQRVAAVSQDLQPYLASLPEPLAALQKSAEALAEIPFTSGNAATLLIDGKQTYAAMLQAIESAKDYILFQFYIINDDEIGQTFLQALVKQANQGVRVYVMYDEIGSRKMTKAYLKTMQRNGIQATKFHSTKGRGNRFQFNFRNHRKILVIDGRTAFVGGFNIGDEYLGKDPKLGAWRDTHMQMQGAAVQCLQITFLKDWYWAMDDSPATNWSVMPDRQQNETIFVLPSAPAQPRETCTLFFNSVFNLARSRLWIASPYFVPDEPTLAALKMAALRGVDVRIILPNRPDHLIVYLCSFSYYNELKTAGIKLYRYKTGFMHQKVMLVDDVIAAVGTVNLDNRSFHLNFEVMAFVTAGQFIQQVETMLKTDLENARLVDYADYHKKSLGFRLAVHIARLMAPLQ